MKLAPLIILAGPSGVGKTTVADHLVQSPELKLRRAITATTRLPRPNEKADVDYHFWDKSYFETAIATQKMLEYAKIHGDFYYGTPLSECEQRTVNESVLLLIDVQGAEQVRKIAQPITIFLHPPTWEDLEKRLRSRGDSAESIARRLQTAQNEIKRSSEFQHQIINGDLSETVRILKGLILSGKKPQNQV